MNNTQIRRPGALAAVFVTVAIVASGCAGATAESAGEPAGGIDIAQATADLEAVVGGADEINVLAVEEAIPTGLTIDYITCPVPVCTEVGKGVQAGADALDWSVRVIANDATPAGYQQAWKQIAQDPSDGVVNAGPVLPYSAVAAEMEQAGVPVVSSTSPDPIGGLLLAVVASSDEIKVQGQAQGDWVVQDAEEPVHSVYVYDPSIPALASAWPGYEEAIQKNCPACTTDVLEVSAAQIGPALAQQVVSYLQAHPDVRYVSFGLGDLATGVPAAVKASGLDKQVSLTVRAATPANLEDVKKGGIAAGFTGELYESGWRAVDALARTFAGASLDDPYPLGLTRLFTPEKLPEDISISYSVPGYKEVFEEAWGLR
ncbi:sugar ABC transporter substrate-binding protein [Microbacterium terregens]|uniref:Sugar ABC transporter substrate-binding protein n=1 Tax=Microbacterium terregens TaxID=69363 RepID=A0ABV5SZ57_9MICO